MATLMGLSSGLRIGFDAELYTSITRSKNRQDSLVSGHDTRINLALKHLSIITVVVKLRVTTLVAQAQRIDTEYRRQVEAFDDSSSWHESRVIIVYYIHQPNNCSSRPKCMGVLR